MVLVLTGGFTYDIFGRRITILVCFIAGAIDCFFTPYTYPHIYPSLLIVKIVYTMSIQPIFSNPLVNDYVTTDSRGRGIALVHLGMNLGHLFSSGVLYNFTNTLNPKITFMVAAIWGAFGGLILMFFVSEPKNNDLIKSSIHVKPSQV